MNFTEYVLAEGESNASIYARHRFAHLSSTVSNFIAEVRDEVRQQCPTYSSQVEVYVENYLCTSSSPTTAANEELQARVHWANAEQTSRMSATSSVTPVSVDEDKDLTFINSNKNLLNTTEQTVYVVSPSNATYWL